LRKKFTGKPEYVINFFRFVAEELRRSWPSSASARSTRWSAARTASNARKAVDHWKARGSTFSSMLHQPDVGAEVGRYCQQKQDHGLDKALDHDAAREDLRAGDGARREGVEFELPSAM
jgi:hypothetical protein